jgi:hypothetical protein
MTTMIDPPSGWRYGFPKALPEDWDSFTQEGRVHWFKNQGYPQYLIDQGLLEYCGLWKVDNEDREFLQ